MSVLPIGIRTLAEIPICSYLDIALKLIQVIFKLLKIKTSESGEVYMNNNEALVAGADAQKALTSQVNIFLFDLKNEATELGFKSGESWNVQMATDDEMLSLKRAHHPVISLRLKPQALLNAYQQVKGQMSQSLNKVDTELSAVDLERDGKNHLAAYPSRILRK
jgi:hypothetical protein